ncbi:MAG: fibronectin type III domain-containing protein [Sedimentisphaerales bacterium]
MKFPTKEPDIIDLADLMFAGYTAHPADFPSINRHSLFITINSYRGILKSQKNLSALAQQATETKNQSLDALKEEMINCLRKSEVDAADNPEKLTEIGWGPKTVPQPTELPGEPKNLIVTKEGRTSVQLRWDRPQAEGFIRNYIIERRQLAGSGSFGNWTVAGTALDTQTNLAGQRRGICLEYRVKAANNAGTGPFSNTVSVVL